MKSKLNHAIAALAVLAPQIVNSHYSSAYAQGTAFTYQGYLESAGNPANGIYDFQFQLFNVATSGSQIGSTAGAPNLGVTNGAFMTIVDFGSQYDGTTYWMQVKVRTNGNGSFTTLSPRQQLTPTPYSITAENVLGSITASQLPAGVLTNTESGVTLNNLTVSGNLSVPDPGGINQGNNSLIYADNKGDFFAGPNAGNIGAPGSYITALGSGALLNNTTGYENTGTGPDALFNNTTGFFNTAYGATAMELNTTGSSNTAVGLSAEFSNRTGGANVGVGFSALYANTNGLYNVAVGAFALKNTPNDNAEVAIGYQALMNDNTGGGFFGTGGNTAVGFDSLMANTTGGENTAVGWVALTGNVTGTGNTAVGALALEQTTASYNTGIGTSALANNTSGANNTAVGYAALDGNSTAQGNTAVGASALGGGYTITGGGNTGTGGSVLLNLTSGYNNTASGYQALQADTTGVDNVAMGVSDFQAITTGSANTAIGTYAFQLMTAGDGNIGVGYYAGHSLVTGSNNVYIANAGASSESDVIRIGSGQTKTFLVGLVSCDGITNNGDFGCSGGVSGEVVSSTGPMIAGTGLLCGGAIIAPSGIFNGNVTCGTLTITGGSDLAEPFAITENGPQAVEGTVMIIDEDHPGQLKVSGQAYDSHVAGVLSGANGVHPGIQMQQQGLLAGGHNVALSGRVYVQADASNGAIHPGDMLTTSSEPGRAMKVTDHVRAQGAILGKAMTSLSEGKGMVLVLVTLQ
ncbi:MAG TPA: hypothetical protein VGO59_17800 [Verrucomicrobiae bacterium]|jgi:hypothetical protein